MSEQSQKGKTIIPFGSKQIQMFLGIILTVFTIYTSATKPLEPTLQRGIILLIVIFIALLSNPLSSKFRIVDYLLAVAAFLSIGYLLLNWEELAYRAQYEPVLMEIALGFAVVIVILELTRRGVGWPLTIVALVVIIYAKFGNYLPALFSHRGYSVSRLVANQYLTHEGVFGSLLGTVGTVVAPFVLFGAVLQFTGVGDLIIDAASIFASKSKGGPAKMAVIASGLFGTISGSSSANVMTTGCTTIPLMKNTGYEPNFAGAVEAAASTGGQIMPPVMGAAAFLMAYVTGIPYLTIAVAAIIPAVFYYAGIFIEVDLEARRIGLKPLGEQGRKIDGRNILGRLYLFLPFALLIYLMAIMFSPAKAAFWATIATLILSGFKKETRLNLNKAKEIIVDFYKGMKTVTLACATAGIVVGALNLTGATLRLTYAFVGVAQGNQLLLMLCVACLCIILGMGLPTPAAYAVAASFAAPALTQIGVSKLAAHLFVLYYASLSSITPPVALAAYAAASISGGSPLKTGFDACRIALVGFIVPFMFVFGPELLLGQVPMLLSIRAAATGIIGVLLLSIAVIGYFNKKVSILERLLYIAAAFLLINPGVYSDFIGLGLGAALLGYHILLPKLLGSRGQKDPT